MANRDHLAIFPSRANKVLIKNRIVSANRGHSLLKRKRDALDLKLTDLIAQRRAIAANCNELFKEAQFSFAKANFLETDFKPVPIIGSDRADAFMRMTYTKTIGVTLPTFESVLRKPESLPLTGLSRGGKQVEVIRDKYQELLKVLVLIASLDYSTKLLKEALRATNTRLNGLEYVIIPRLINTSDYITNELDEMEREEFYRLKRSQQKQHKLKAQAKEEEMKQRKAEDSDVSQLDASTSIDFNKFNIPIFKKVALTTPTQTIITGHFPQPEEVISPTDSVISGDYPVTIKRSKYGDLIVKPQPNQGDESIPSRQESKVLARNQVERKTSGNVAQTVITGHYPEEMISPTDSVISGDIPVVRKRSKYEISNKPKSGDKEPTSSNQELKRESPTSGNEKYKANELESPSTNQFDKKAASNTNQNNIASRFPDTDKVISPYDTGIGGTSPVIKKESPYEKDKAKGPSAEHAAQTVITGHFPDSDEVISPSDSVFSGANPVIRKKSPNEKNVINEPTSSNQQPESQTYNQFDKSTADRTAQTVVTGRSPDPDEVVSLCGSLVDGTNSIVGNKSRNEKDKSNEPTSSNPDHQSQGSFHSGTDCNEDEEKKEEK